MNVLSSCEGIFKAECSSTNLHKFPQLDKLRAPLSFLVDVEEIECSWELLSRRSSKWMARAASIAMNVLYHLVVTDVGGHSQSVVIAFVSDEAQNHI